MGQTSDLPSDLLLDLVAIPSVSADSNQRVVEYIARYLDPELWDLRFYSHSSGETTKTNLVALTRNTHANEVELALVCHTDTVPFDPEWTEAVHPCLRDGKIWGRGSADVKGFLACVLAAVSRLDPAALARPIALVFTADEEIGCIGAKHLAEQKAFSARFMIIGEPTGLRPMRAGKGYSLASIAVKGKEGHSAYPSGGRSAIYDAARVVSALERVAATMEDERNSSFDPPFTTLNVGLIQGGTAKNIIPGECRLTVEWRPIPGQDPDRVARLIAEALATLEKTSGLDAEFTVIRKDPAFAPSETRVLANLLESLTGDRPGTISFGSEAAHLSPLAREIVVLGPGDMSVAHQTGEFVEVRDLDRCVMLLGAVLARLCGHESIESKASGDVHPGNQQQIA